jgi:pyruvate dehydrogenase E2 component (dihydrolipoamide acetyltransferase)
MPQTTPDRGDGNGRVLATPLARAVAADLGVDLATVTGSGRGGRIMRADVEAAATPAPAAAHAAAGDMDEVPLSAMRRVVARRLVESMQAAPHFFLTIRVDARGSLASGPS